MFLCCRFELVMELLQDSDGNSDRNSDGNSDFDWEFPSEKQIAQTRDLSQKHAANQLKKGPLI